MNLKFCSIFFVIFIYANFFAGLSVMAFGGLSGISESSGIFVLKSGSNTRVWGALIFAKRGSSGYKKVSPALLKQLRGTFSKYDNFYLLGQQIQRVHRDRDSWIVPSSKRLFLKMNYNGSGGVNSAKLNLQLWQGKKVLLKTNCILRVGKPLYIEGPSFEGGRLIFAIKLR